MPCVGEHLEPRVRVVAQPGLAHRVGAQRRVVLADDGERRYRVALHVVGEVSTRPGGEVGAERLPGGVIEGEPDHLVQPAAGQPVAGGEVDDGAPVVRVGGRTVEQRPALQIEGHPAGRDRADADEAVHPPGGVGEYPLGGAAAHGVPDHRERVPAEGVGERQGVAGDLRESVVARDPGARAVPAVVQKSPGEALGVDQVRQPAPALRRPEPPVQGQHLARAPTDHDRTAVGVTDADVADRHGGDPFRCGGAETEVHDLRTNKVNAGDVRATVVGARTERKSSRRVCRARPSRGPSAVLVDGPRAAADPLWGDVPPGITRIAEPCGNCRTALGVTAQAVVLSYREETGMQQLWRRAAVATALSITGVLGGLATVAPAQAETMAALDLQLTVAGEGTASSVSGKAIVHGTVACSQPASVSVSGAVFQVVKKVLVRGTFGALVSCTPGTAVAWTASATPNDTTPFGKGDAEVSTQATAYDSEYGDYATVDDTTIVTLSRS